MSKKIVTNSMIAGAVAAAVSMGANVQPAQAKMLKCYGIAKAGQNDCKAGPGTTCAGSSKVDYQGNAWKKVEAKSCSDVKVKMGGKMLKGSDKPLKRNLPG